MVRMRQVYATTRDRKSRIYDETDERKPSFFVKHLFVDFEPDQLENAWCIDDDELPFGFEYINKILLREINFGNQDPFSKTVQIGGSSLQAKGFHLCQSCGKVQKKTKQREEQQPLHTSSCTAKNKGKEALIDGILLYRELQSEAVRILLPVRAITDDETLQSFIAALFLGLQQYFGGKINHLASTKQHITIKNSPHGQTYLILYDRIPGAQGTSNNYSAVKMP